MFPLPLHASVGLRQNLVSSYKDQIQLGRLIPNKVTLTRLPEEPNVDTISGMPKMLSVTVMVPSAFTVSVPPPNKLLRNATKKGVFKAGGGDGEGDGDGGGAGDGDGGAAGTVRVAAVLVAVPALLVKTASYSLPFMDVVTLFSVRVVLVAPLMLVQVVPPSLLTCHCTVGVGVPLAAAVKEAGPPAVTVWLLGWVVMAGAAV